MANKFPGILYDKILDAPTSLYAVIAITKPRLSTEDHIAHRSRSFYADSRYTAAVSSRCPWVNGSYFWPYSDPISNRYEACRLNSGESPNPAEPSIMRTFALR